MSVQGHVVFGQIGSVTFANSEYTMVVQAGLFVPGDAYPIDTVAVSEEFDPHHPTWKQLITEAIVAYALLTHDVEVTHIMFPDMDVVRL